MSWSPARIKCPCASSGMVNRATEKPDGARGIPPLYFLGSMTESESEALAGDAFPAFPANEHSFHRRHLRFEWTRDCCRSSSGGRRANQRRCGDKRNWMGKPRKHSLSSLLRGHLSISEQHKSTGRAYFPHQLASGSNMVIGARTRDLVQIPILRRIGNGSSCNWRNT